MAESGELDSLRANLARISKRYSLPEADVLAAMQEDQVPVAIFSSALSPLEALVQFLKEQQDLSLSHIAGMLNRSEKTIWQAYHFARKKKVRFRLGRGPSVSTRLFSSRRHSILENLACHLKDGKNMTLHEIAILLDRDDRTIWTVYHRAKKKDKEHARE